MVCLMPDVDQGCRISEKDTEQNRRDGGGSNHFELLRGKRGVRHDDDVFEERGKKGGQGAGGGREV